MTDAVVAALHVYPVKGLHSVSPARVDVVPTGFTVEGAGDREWMLVDDEGRFVTQRELPRMALVRTAVADDALVLSAQGRAPLRVPLAGGDGPARDVHVWQSAVRGFDAGDEVARWLSALLERPLRLLRFDRSHARPCNPEFAGERGAHTLFADGYPVLVIGTASLADLNARLASHGSAPLPMDRFRPNLVLAGLPAYDEDHLDTITVGNVVLRCVKPCTRCQVTTTDQRTAVVGVEPLATLGTYRMNEALAGVTFGMNAIVVAGGPLAVGASADIAYRF